MAPAKLNDFAGVAIKAFVDRAVEPSNDLLCDGDRENVFCPVPDADDVISSRLILRRFRDEVGQFSNTLPHAIRSLTGGAPASSDSAADSGALTFDKVKRPFDEQHCASFPPLDALAALTPETTAPPKPFAGDS